jgi:hypothetical protein
MRFKGSIAKGVLFALALTLIPVASFSAQKVTPGNTCKVLNQKLTYGNKTYACIKSGKKLVWNKGVAIKTTPTPTPTPTQSTQSIQSLSSPSTTRKSLLGRLFGSSGTTSSVQLSPSGNSLTTPPPLFTQQEQQMSQKEESVDKDIQDSNQDGRTTVLLQPDVQDETRVSKAKPPRGRRYSVKPRMEEDDTEDMVVLPSSQSFSSSSSKQQRQVIENKVVLIGGPINSKRIFSGAQQNIIPFTPVKSSDNLKKSLSPEHSPEQLPVGSPTPKKN